MDLREFDHQIKKNGLYLFLFDDGSGDESRECINWAELPSELTSSILGRLDTVDILNNAQKVCRSWRRVCKDPAMWRKIDMRNSDAFGYDVHIIMIVMRYSGDLNLEVMWRHAVDLSQGGLVEIDFGYIGTDSFLNYIAHSSSNLRSLKFAFMPTITIEGLTEALGKLPLLEEFEVSHFTLLGDSLKVVGQSCPKLKTLKLHRYGMGPPRDVSDDDALAIAETMPGLRFLQLVGNCLTDVGLNAILDNCPYLEHLDLRLCLNLTNLVGDLEIAETMHGLSFFQLVGNCLTHAGLNAILDNCPYLEHLDLRLCLNLTNLVGDLEKRCSERIKVLRRPIDSTHDYPYDVYFYEDDPFEDDYPEDYDI
ncbi:F-box protein SKIP19 [Raphanus sativus]|nr:F-box protein SKIP19 [Raphanus sativus]